MKRNNRSVLGLWASTMEAQAATWTTLAIRVPLLMTGTMTPAEQSRMVTEKLEAWSESTQAASMSVGQMMLDPNRAFQSPFAMMNAMLALSSAAAHPYHKRVTSNARRLQKRNP